MRPDTTRIFVAVPLPDEQVSALSNLSSKILPGNQAIRFVDPSHYHLTLVFLGDVENAGLNAVCQAVVESSARFEPFELQLTGLSAFPNITRPRNVWVGLSGPGLETLHSLQKAVVRALRQAGYPPEDSRFSPHVTLARIRNNRGRVSPPDLSRVTQEYRDWSCKPFLVVEVVAFSSNLTSNGPEYTTLVRAPLQGRKPGTNA